jgi:hypothetical protein
MDGAARGPQILELFRKSLPITILDTKCDGDATARARAACCSSR